jgi:hypothetical protein
LKTHSSTNHEQIATLRKRRDALQERIKELSEASEGACQALQAGINDAWNELSDVVSQAQTNFKEKA